MHALQRHPIDGILADLGTIVRRSDAGTLTEPEYVEIADRIKADLKATRADPDDMIMVRLNLLKAMEDAGTLTSGVFHETMAGIRTRLMLQRARPWPVVPNFAVLPSGIHGRRIGAFVVVDGGASTHTQTSLKGA